MHSRKLFLTAAPGSYYANDLMLVWYKLHDRECTLKMIILLTAIWNRTIWQGTVDWDCYKSHRISAPARKRFQHKIEHRLKIGSRSRTGIDTGPDTNADSFPRIFPPLPVLPHAFRIRHSRPRRDSFDFLLFTLPLAEVRKIFCFQTARHPFSNERNVLTITCHTTTGTTKHFLGRTTFGDWRVKMDKSPCEIPTFISSKYITKIRWQIWNGRSYAWSKVVM